jgi:hypothetical protein
MDKLAEQLKLDAGQIDVHICDELEHRIDASLRGITPVPESATATKRASFWWASSLTGATAALLIIGFVNFSSSPETAPDIPHATSPIAQLPAIPTIEWRVQPAMLTSPLRQELEDLRSDARKAEQIVRGEIGL